MKQECLWLTAVLLVKEPETLHQGVGQSGEEEEASKKEKDNDDDDDEEEGQVRPLPKKGQPDRHTESGRRQVVGSR